MPDQGAPDIPSGDGGARGERLPCGVDVDELLTQVADRAAPSDPTHQRSCPHCRAALAEIRRLWEPVHALAAEDVRTPAELLQAVMDQVRRLPRNTWYAVLPGPGGQTRIAARVVGAVARLAAESVPRVTLALGGGRTATPRDAPADAALDAAAVAGPEGEAATDIGVAGTHVVVDIQIAVDFGASIPAVARQVRDQIARHIAAQTGLTTAEVNVTVVDVQAHPAPGT